MASGKNQLSSDFPKKEASGLKAEFSAFVHDALAYLQLRGSLFSIEAKEAGQIYGKKFGFIIAGVILLLLGYLLLIAGGIGIIALALNPDTAISWQNWIGGAFILSAVHFLPGIILLRKGLKSTVDRELFEYTRNELKKEQEWLKQKK
jgi:uncharacterized membrane protein YqjE